MNTTTPRWNATQAAADYDSAAPEIHPCYEAVHQAVDQAVPDGASHVVDLGGGSGRLVERLLSTRPQATAVIVDPSEAFLRLARQRLRQLEDRCSFLPGIAQGGWATKTAQPEVIVSTSALHHLDPAGKNTAFEACYKALPPGGLFVNGDEYRPPSDAAYRDLLEEWHDHMRSSLAAGLIPASFTDMVDRWEQRNLHNFGGPRQTGDDCHETIEEQIARLYGAGFSDVQVTWHDRLWAVLVAQR